MDNYIYIIYFCRELNLWRKKRLVGPGSLGGNRCRPFSEGSRISGSHPSHPYRHQGKLTATCSPFDDRQQQQHRLQSTKHNSQYQNTSIFKVFLSSLFSKSLNVGTPSIFNIFPIYVKFWFWIFVSSFLISYLAGLYSDSWVCRKNKFLDFFYSIVTLLNSRKSKLCLNSKLYAFPLLNIPTLFPKFD